LIVSFPGQPATKLPSTTGEQAVAVTFAPSGELLVQSREPATLRILDTTQSTWRTVPLSQVSRADLGHEIFHSTAGALVACASCHPEGGEDSHTWILDGEARRTPSLRGTIAGTAPYHWPGDQADIPSLLTDVYTGRMEGAPLTTAQSQTLEAWVNAIPAPPAPSWVDAASAARGQALFASTGCTTCHSGTKFTNNQTVDVGTGGFFQVPPLVGVGWRTPLLHDGCAATIADRFGACATPQHSGSAAALTADQVADLTTYLETL
jgi:cytochrome c553